LQALKITECDIDFFLTETNVGSLGGSGFGLGDSTTTLADIAGYILANNDVLNNAQLVETFSLKARQPIKCAAKF
jgi:hypothetical protein